MDGIPARDEVFPVVRSCVADSLAVRPDDVTLASRIIADLGANSLDFIDIVFMLEKKFGLKLRETEFDFLSRLDLSSPQVMREGFLTPATVDRLREWLPALGAVPDPRRVTPGHLFSLLTVETICLIVEKKLAARP